MSKPILYHMHYSPPSRFALLAAKHIGLDIDIKHVDFFSAEHMSDKFKAINPTSTVPALVDGLVNIFDSSAIAIYLVEKYAKENTLYPKDLLLRTKVNEKLFYVSSYIFPRLYQIMVSAYAGEELEIPQKKIDEMLRGYHTIESFLTGQKYLAGDFLSLADLSLWAIMESLHQVIPIDQKTMPNFFDWLENMRKLPGNDVNRKGADEHIEFFRKRVEDAKQGIKSKII